MKRIFITFSFFIFIFCSCQKTISPFEDNIDSTSIDSSYLPLSANSYWKYSDSQNTAEITTHTSLGLEASINGKKYTKFLLTRTGYTDTFYYARTGAEYYSYLHLTVSGMVADLETLFLNDTASVGFTWQQDAGSVNGFPARNNGLISEKNITMVVEGKTYQNVIHTFISLQYNLLGTWETFSTYHYYVAKGVGIIKTSSLIDYGGTVFMAASNLVDYSIK